MQPPTCRFKMSATCHYLSNDLIHPCEPYSRTKNGGDLSTRLYIYIYIYMCVSIYIYIYITYYFNISIHEDISMQIHLYIHSYIHAYTLRYIHAHTHIEEPASNILPNDKGGAGGNCINHRRTRKLTCMGTT